MSTVPLKYLKVSSFWVGLEPNRVYVGLSFMVHSHIEKENDDFQFHITTYIVSQTIIISTEVNTLLSVAMSPTLYVKLPLSSTPTIEKFNKMVLYSWSQSKFSYMLNWYVVFICRLNLTNYVINFSLLPLPSL